jgi:nucleoside-diphosphate-sugar epimerase
VVWLAGIVGDPACALDEELTRKINVESLRWLCQNFDGRIIFPSTCSVYGAQDGELDEDSPTNPLSLYANTKLDAERHLRSERPGSLILRLATLAGVGDSYSRIRLDLVVNIMVVRATMLRRLQVFGGRQFRPFLDVRDVATAVVPHLESDSCGVFNIGAENTTILDLAERVVNHVPGTEIEVVDTPFEDTRNYRVSFKKAAQELGLTSLHSVDDSIERIGALIQAGRIKDPSMAQFSNLEALRPYLKPEAIPLGMEIRAAHSLARHTKPHGTTVAPR